uniref:MBD domain-containing protein n=1 Tax=Schizaphis graminum TaxID=13262 RepID=A0A2S2NLZ6_SCHGA
MDKLERKKSAGLKETNLLNLEARFIGFDIDDEVLIIIENKKKSLKMELSKESGEPMEVDEPTDSPSIVNNNHVNKKKQSKSSISSPEPNDVKNNRSNKRHKKDNTHSDTLESSELHVPPSLELTTPTFNLTSSNTRMRRSSGRKINVDITDAIFKLPFEHGWKRELVYRTSGESTVLNRANRSGDVYYYSPNNRKLRSLREIQEQLDISSDKTLTIESFTFLKQPIGMNDRSKELIRDANSKLSKVI